MEKTLDDEKAIQAFKALVLNNVINNYAVERVAFGYEKPSDKAPIDLYLKQIFLGFDYEPQMRKDICGLYIDEQERISAEYDYAEYVHDLFVMQMERIFFDASKDIGLERDGEEIPLLPSLRNYLFGILPLFTEVLNVEAECNAFDLITTDKQAHANEYNVWLKFVTSILLERLSSGCLINKYVKDMKNAPHYISRLIDKKGDNFYLNNIDINSYVYIFALFSLMIFKNDENGKLLELKMREWERRHRPQ
ncbi:MAG: hypothetical protein K2J01_03260 [Clostridiales bacterium]|nr:hypothetical protein [Clostridiales bacterium]